MTFIRRNYEEVLKEVLKENEINILSEKLQKANKEISSLSKILAEKSLELESLKKMNETLRDSIRILQMTNK